VVVDSIETNNADMLKVARAFEAELALRQGYLAVASRWAEKCQAKPLRPTYRFYMPQVTLIRTLLAQGTTDSRQQAADLLDQMLAFYRSIHNKRFQIDLLALQALLHDSQNNKPAALKTLTEALALAEPGGFIRLFVDLSSRMADLLKRLQKQNVAVDYIEELLAAIRDDEHRPVPDATDQNSSSPHHPLSPPTPSQPLVDPLTNRELDVLELLTQRFQNKEIAEKLFISPETVKKHLNNIYGKLSVSDRRQAISKAMDLGILTR
jgi:LuxR family maltose regulon positive regulatory protein